MSEQNLNSD